MPTSIEPRLIVQSNFYIAYVVTTDGVYTYFAVARVLGIRSALEVRRKLLCKSLSLGLWMNATLFK